MNERYLSGAMKTGCRAILNCRRQTWHCRFVGGWSAILCGISNRHQVRPILTVSSAPRSIERRSIFTQVDKDCFALSCLALSCLAEALRSDVPGSLRDILITIGEIHYRTCGDLLHSVRSGFTAFNQVFGMTLFDYLQKNADASDSFNRGMTNLSSLLAHAVLLAYDFSGISSIVHVGGGEGQLKTTPVTSWIQLQNPSQ